MQEWVCTTFCTTPVGVPVLIGLNWVIVVLGAIAPTEEFTSVAWRQRYSR